MGLPHCPHIPTPHSRPRLHTLHHRMLTVPHCWPQLEAGGEFIYKTGVGPPKHVYAGSNLSILMYVQPMVLTRMLVDNSYGDTAGSGFASRFLFSFGGAVSNPPPCVV